jgi:hypothetical protein
MTWKTVDGQLFACQFVSLLFWVVWNVIYSLCGPSCTADHLLAGNRSGHYRNGRS